VSGIPGLSSWFRRKSAQSKCGTQFNVRVREGWLEVGVLSGIVKVTTTRNGVDSSLTVTKDQVVVCAEGNVPEMRPALPYPEYPAWLHGKLTFDRTNLIAGCKELESQFDIVITVRSPALRKETITGTIDSRNAETALSTLARLTGNRYRHEDSSYVLY
jgi:ferric-dicitrate binding protein FerR (iron transport regulator)